MASMLQRSLLRPATRSAILGPLARPRLLSTLISQHRIIKPVADTRWRGLRWNSTNSTFLPEAPLPPVNDLPIETLTDAVAAIPPLQQGDLAALGLCNWTPAGMVQYSFEAVHLVTGLPWFWTFVAATLFWRVTLFPFAVAGMQNASRMKPIQPLMRVQAEKMNAARQAGDVAGMQQASLELAQIRKSAGVTTAGMMVPPLVQLPISLGMFIGIKSMCELPVIQLAQSGFAWLPDLTQPSPYYILPIILAASGNGLIMLSSRDADLSNATIAHLMNVLRMVSFVAIPFMGSLPSGVLVSLVVTSLASMGQALLLRLSAVRAFFGIAPLDPSTRSQLPTLRESLKYYLPPK